jgi:diguanylate cyclase (GGDEF)-like protein/putative nucleotidyltransferase with HDIG domain
VKNLIPSEYNLQAQIFWWFLLLSSVTASGMAVVGLVSFSTLQFVGLFVALIIAAVVNQHQFTIPQTKITLTAREIVIFWGIIWLGVPGGVLLAACVLAASYKNAPKDKVKWLLDGFINITSACAAGAVFYFVLKQLAGFTENAVAENTIAVGWVVAAAIPMAFTQYLLSFALETVFIKLQSAPSDEFDSPKEKPVFSFKELSISLAIAFGLHLVFLVFGLSFSFVILPLVFVGQLAYRLHVARLDQKTKEIMEASRVHLATVEALATAIDARDQVGIGHVRRTQIYAVGIGEMLNLSETELHALNTGALLHDIGKLAVPDHILNKPGRLTPAEMEKIKIHSSVGASILEKIEFSYPVIPTIKYHHEMWDGNGYPEGLKGENIPLTARILAVADAFDTLRGARPYRAAISRDDARRFLLSGAGAQFDPKIVDVFLRNLKKFEAEVEAQGFSYVYDKKSTENVHCTYDDTSSSSYVEQIKRANREVFALYELARVFSSSLNLQEALSLFVKKIGELVPFDTCVVYLMDESEEFAKAAYIEGENKSILKDKCVKPGEGATGFVLKKRQPVYKIEPELDFTFNQFEQDYTAMTSLPLIADERLLGAVSLYSLGLGNYEEEHLRLLETVSRIASDAIGMSLQHAESESRALTDPMTDLPNARSLQMQFEKEAARADRNGSNFQLLMLDLDGFKAVNDTFGHKVGDKLLKELAKIMLGQLRDYDFLARYAGDEFVAVVPETDSEGIQDLCQRIEKAVNDFSLPVGDDRFAKVGISIGAAAYPTNGDMLDQVIIAADKAMYAVKADRKQAKATQQLPPDVQEIIATSEEVMAENFIVELDESHIVSSAIN